MNPTTATVYVWYLITFFLGYMGVDLISRFLLKKTAVSCVRAGFINLPDNKAKFVVTDFITVVNSGYIALGVYIADAFIADFHIFISYGVSVTNAALILLTARWITSILGPVLDTLESYLYQSIAQFRWSRIYRDNRQVFPVIKQSLNAQTWVLASTSALSQFYFLSGVTQIGGRVLVVVTIFVFARLLINFSKISIRSKFLISADPDSALYRQRSTVSLIAVSGISYLVWIVALIVTFYIFGIDPGPIFASAALLGLVVGLGSQDLIKDLLNGLLIFIDNQFLVGDDVAVSVGDKIFTGRVIALSLRTTRIKDIKDCSTHIIRNGAICHITKRTNPPKVES